MTISEYIAAAPRRMIECITDLKVGDPFSHAQGRALFRAVCATGMGPYEILQALTPHNLSGEST